MRFEETAVPLKIYGDILNLTPGFCRIDDSVTGNVWAYTLPGRVPRLLGVSMIKLQRPQFVVYCAYEAIT